MGGLLSTPSENPSENHSQHATMSSAESSRMPEPLRTEKETSESEQKSVQLRQVLDPQMDGPQPVEDGEPINSEKGEQEEEEEEEGECGFCLFMKGGGCRETFINWENCVEEAEKNKEDIVDKCFEVTGALKKCMEAHSDYYAPILQAEKAAEEEAVKELEREKAKESGSSTSSSSSTDPEERTSTVGSAQDPSKDVNKIEVS